MVTKLQQIATLCGTMITKLMGVRDVYLVLPISENRDELRVQIDTYKYSTLHCYIFINFYGWVSKWFIVYLFNNVES